MIYGGDADRRHHHVHEIKLKRLETACVDGIHKAGYWFDYVNDDVLMNWECYGYDTLLLIECDRIPVAVMKKFRNLQTVEEL